MKVDFNQPNGFEAKAVSSFFFFSYLCDLEQRLKNILDL